MVAVIILLDVLTFQKMLTSNVKCTYYDINNYVFKEGDRSKLVHFVKAGEFKLCSMIELPD